MRLIEVGQVWGNEFTNHLYLVIQIDGGKAWARKINLLTGASRKTLLVHCGIHSNQYYAYDFWDWRLITDPVILDRVKRLDWADKYL